MSTTEQAWTPTGPTDDDRDAGTAPESAPVRITPARPPVGTPGVAAVSIVLVLALLGLGTVLLRELLVSTAVNGEVLVPGDPWLAPVAASATGVIRSSLTLAVAVAVGLLGLLLVVSALKPRPSPTSRLVGDDDAAISFDVDERGLTALAADAALGVTEVETSRASGGRRRMVVHVSVDPRAGYDRSAIAGQVSRLVQERLSGLRPPPRVAVRVHGDSSR